MNETEQILSLMTELKHVLEEEKNILIHNKGKQVAEIVQKKEKLMEQLSKYSEENVRVQDLLPLSQEIKELQETNLLLTQQSLAYSEMLFQNIQKNAQKQNAYSKKGTLEQSQAAAFLDESL